MNLTPQNRDRIAKWLRLHLAREVGPVTFAKLLKYFGTIDQALEATPGQLTDIPGIGRATAEKIYASQNEVDVDAELELARKHHIDILTLTDPDYPPLLRQIHDPPHVLYVKGSLSRADNLSLAVVGSRNCSHYGQEQASRLSHFLAAAGFTIVSGLARGIDTAAHRGALTAEGRTLAVLGCGLANIYPPENADLAGRITQNGALLSELPLTFEPLAGTFPTRNRIIAGLSLGTLIVEARSRSGALITAQYALEQNREVLAVPGRIDSPGSAGPHQLIKDGAKLVTGIQDILDALGLVGDLLQDHAQQTTELARQNIEPSLFDAPPSLTLTPAETAVLDALDSQPLHIDELITLCHLPPAPVNAALTALQLKGLLNQLPGSFYQKRK